jgi:hypothetical protein
MEHNQLKKSSRKTIKQTPVTNTWNNPKRMWRAPAKKNMVFFFVLDPAFKFGQIWIQPNFGAKTNYTQQSGVADEFIIISAAAHFGHPNTGAQNELLQPAFVVRKCDELCIQKLGLGNCDMHEFLEKFSAEWTETALRLTLCKSTGRGKDPCTHATLAPLRRHPLSIINRDYQFRLIPNPPGAGSKLYLSNGHIDLWLKTQHSLEQYVRNDTYRRQEQTSTPIHLLNAFVRVTSQMKAAPDKTEGHTFHSRCSSDMTLLSVLIFMWHAIQNNFWWSAGAWGKCCKVPKTSRDKRKPQMKEKQNIQGKVRTRLIREGKNRWRTD